MLEPWLLQVVGRSVGCLIGCDFFECSNEQLNRVCQEGMGGPSSSGQPEPELVDMSIHTLIQF